MNNYRTKNRRSKQQVSSIGDPSRLIKKGIESKSRQEYISNSKFDDLRLHNVLKRNLAFRKYEKPTEIQEKTINYLLDGRDVIGIANTGTGKTGAFLIPVLNQILEGKLKDSTLIIVPTRELAVQIEKEFRLLTQGLSVSMHSCIGGTSVNKDIQSVRQRKNLIVGTPGRLMDLKQRGALNMNSFSVLILDEFDRMLDMGFINDIESLTSAMKNRKQTMLFSATLDPKQKGIVAKMVNNPIEVKVNTGQSTNDNIEQDIIRVPKGGDKLTILLEMMRDKDFQKVLIFSETKRLVDKLTKKLSQSGIKAVCMHGNKSQNYRNKALEQFKKGKAKVLVATDVAARGIDISDITHVINYQLPRNYDSYIHRIGRTGRAGKLGKAFTFID